MGYWFSKPWHPSRDMLSQQGKVFVVTGGNSGIGYATVYWLAKKEAKVYLAARSQDKFDKAIEDMQREDPKIEKGRIEFLPLDLASFRSILEAVEMLKSKERAIDVLVNNAATVPEDYETVEAGWERSMAICHFGHFLLTNELMPLMKEAAKKEGSDVRVVTTSTPLANMMPPKITYDLTAPATSPSSFYNQPCASPLSRSNFWPRINRYTLAKMANILFARELQRRLDAEQSPVTSVSLDPGGVKTPGTARILPPWLFALTQYTMLDVLDGASATLWAATDPKVRAQKDKGREEEGGWGGGFLVSAEKGGRLGALAAVLRREGAERELWESTEREVEQERRRLGV